MLFNLGTDQYFLPWGWSLFGKKLSAYKKWMKKLLAEKNSLKNCLHKAGKVGEPFLFAFYLMPLFGKVCVLDVSQCI